MGGGWRRERGALREQAGEIEGGDADAHRHADGRKQLARREVAAVIVLRDAPVEAPQLVRHDGPLG